MTFIERVTSLRKEKQVTEKQVLIDCNLNKNLFGNWKKGVSPSSATLSVLATYFDVSVEYLLGKTDNRKEASALDAKTEEFIKIYELLTPDHQKQIRVAIADLLKDQLQE